MESHYTIGALARQAGVPISTVRYYERVGLLVPAGRTVNNYRSYDPSSVERLRFIRAAQNSGFSLEDISCLLDYRGAPGSARREVRALIHERLRDMDKRLKELRHVRRVLNSLLKACCSAGESVPCNVITMLNRESSVSSAVSPCRERRKKNGKPS